MVGFHKLKSFYRQVHYQSAGFLNRNMNWRSFQEAKGLQILVYHGICKENPFRFNHLFLTQKAFEEQLILFKRFCNLVTLDDAFSGNYDQNQFNICITFDDGYANNFELGLPILEKYKIPACFFLTGIRQAGYTILWNDFLSILQAAGPASLFFCDVFYFKNRHRMYVSKEGVPLRAILQNGNFQLKADFIKSFCSCISWEKESVYWLQLSEKQINQMASSSFVTIGFHGLYHNDLTSLDISEAITELDQGKAYLESIIQKSIKSLAYPYGHYNMPLVKEAKALGFTQQLIAKPNGIEKQVTDVLKGRLTINPFCSAPQQLSASIKGTYA